MLATYGAAALIVVASLLIGRALLELPDIVSASVVHFRDE